LAQDSLAKQTNAHSCVDPFIQLLGLENLIDAGLIENKRWCQCRRGVRLHQLQVWLVSQEMCAAQEEGQAFDVGL
jgi:hypothetical protein